MYSKMRRCPIIQSSSAMKTILCIYFVTTISFFSRHTCYAGWVDPDTPEKYHTINSNYADDTREYELVRVFAVVFNWVLSSTSLPYNLISHVHIFAKLMYVSAGILR